MQLTSFGSQRCNIQWSVGLEKEKACFLAVKGCSVSRQPLSCRSGKRVNQMWRGLIWHHGCDPSISWMEFPPDTQVPPPLLLLILGSISCLRKAWANYPKLAFYLDRDLTPWFAFQALKKWVEANPLLSNIKPDVLMGRGRKDQKTCTQVCSEAYQLLNLWWLHYWNCSALPVFVFCALKQRKVMQVCTILSSISRRPLTNPKEMLFFSCPESLVKAAVTLLVTLCCRILLAVQKKFRNCSLSWLLVITSRGIFLIPFTEHSLAFGDTKTF